MAPAITYVPLSLEWPDIFFRYNSVVACSCIWYSSLQMKHS